LSPLASHFHFSPFKLFYMSASGEEVRVFSEVYTVNVTGYPGVFQGNPHPHPWKPVPVTAGTGFYGYGLWVL
jgi:hypothetical protein